METAIGYAGEIPMVVPLVSLTLVMAITAIAIILMIGITFLVDSDFQVAIAMTGEGSVLVYFMPAVAQTMSEGAVVVTSSYDLIRSIAEFLKSDALKLILVALLAAICVYGLENQDQLQNSIWTLWTTDPVLSYRHLFLHLFNLANLAASSAMPAYNAYSGFTMSRLTMLYKTMKSCAKDTITSTLETLIVQIAELIGELAEALSDFFMQDLLVARINLIPAFSKIGQIGTVVNIYLDCGCRFLNFTYTGPIEWLQTPSLHIGLNHAVNAAIAVPQAVFDGVINLRFPQIEEIVKELNPALLYLGDAIEDLVSVVVDVAVNIVDFLPKLLTMHKAVAVVTGTAVDPSTLTLGKLMSVIESIHPHSLPKVSSIAASSPHVQHLFRPAFLPPIPLNISDILGLGFLAKVASAPWSRIATETAVAALILINGTWSLSRIITEGELDSTDIRFFQLGHISDHLRLAADAIGSLFGVFEPKLHFVISDIPAVLITTYGLVYELIIGTFFFVAYDIDPNDPNPFEYAVHYCNKTSGTEARRNYNLLYNHSGALAELFGCDGDDEAYELDSPGAVCADAAFACLVMSLYRFAIESQELIFRTACFFSELIQFNPNKATFRDISTDGIYRQLINIFVCFKRMIWLFDFEEPNPGHCVPDAPSPYEMKISVMCMLGEILEAIQLAYLALFRQVTDLLQAILIAFPFPSYANKIKIPTFEDSIKNLQVVLCRTGGLIGSILPVNFDCDAQAGSDPDPPRQLAGPIRPWGRAVDIPMSAAQVDPDAMCGFTPLDWSGGGLPLEDLDCDCNNSALWAETNYVDVLTSLSSPACFLECAQPSLIQFPFRIGSDPQVAIGNTPYPFYMGVTFTSASAVRRFLTTPLRPLDEMTEIPYGPLDLTFVDPDPLDPNLNGGAWLAHLITGKLNARLQGQFGLILPRMTTLRDECKAAIVAFVANNVEFSNVTTENMTFPNCSAVNLSEYNGTDCDENSTGADMLLPETFGTKAPDTLNWSRALNYMMLPDYVDVIEFFAYGNYLSAIVPGMFTAIDEAFLPHTQANAMARVVYWMFHHVLFNNVSAVATWRVLLAPIVFYNNKFGSCPRPETDSGFRSGADARQCFALEAADALHRQTMPSGRPTMQPVPEDFRDSDRMCTYAPGATTYGLAKANETQLALECDCAGNATYSYYGNGNGHCLLYCDPIAYPFFLGSRPTDCMAPGACTAATASVPIMNASAARAVLLQDTSSPLYDYRPSIWITKLPKMANNGGDLDVLVANPELQKVAVTPDLRHFAPAMIAASLNLHYLARYVPSRYLFVRTLDDPLMTAHCFELEATRRLFGGVSVTAMVRAINQTFFGDSNVASLRCDAQFDRASDEFIACGRLRALLPPAPSVLWGVQYATHIARFLELVNTFRPGCNVGHQCFVVSTSNGSAIKTSLGGSGLISVPDLPPLDFVSKSYDHLPFYTTATIPKCESLDACLQQTVCTIGRIGTVPLELASNVIVQINMAISGGSGTWTLGSGMWEMLQMLSGVVIGSIFGTLLSLVSALDCLLCAIAGNVVGNALCKSALYGYLRPIIVTLDRVLTKLVSTLIDLVRIIVETIYYFFAGNFAKVASLLIDFLWSLAVDFLWEIIKAIFGLAMGLICICPLFEDLDCDNAGWCDGKRKRAIEALGALFKVTSTPAAVRYLYMLFADGSWPPVPADSSSGWTWAAGDECATKMPALEAAAANSSLTEREAEIVAYCLSKKILFTPEALEEHDLGGHIGSVAPDWCWRHMRLMVVDNALRPFHNFDISTQSYALECIAKEGVRYNTRDGHHLIDWWPENPQNPLAWVEVFGVASIASRAEQEYWRDDHYEEHVLESPEYQAGAARAYGESRVSLVQQRLQTGETAPLEDYVASVMGLEPTTPMKKRSPVENLKFKKVASLANFINVLHTVLVEEVEYEDASDTFNGAPTYVEKMVAAIDRRMATKPPALALAPDGVSPTITTAAARAAQIAALNNSQELHSSLRSQADRITGGFWSIVSDVYHYTKAEASKKRALAFTEEYAGPDFDVLAQVQAGLRGLAGIAGEIFSGKAYRNATGELRIASNGEPVKEPCLVKWRVNSRVDREEMERRLPPGYTLEMFRKPTVERFFGSTITRDFNARAEAIQEFFLNMAGQDPGVQDLIERQKRVGETISTWKASFYAGAAIARIKSGGTMEQAIAEFGVIPDLEEECFLLYEYYSTYTGFVINMYAFYIDPILRPEFSIVYGMNTFQEISNMLRDPSVPVIFGDSPTNPARWPTRDVRPLANFGDRVQNKLRFNDAQPLVDKTLAFFSSLFSAFQIDEISYIGASDTPKFVQLRVGGTAVPHASTRPHSTLVDHTRRQLRNLVYRVIPEGTSLDLCAFVSENSTAHCRGEGELVPVNGTEAALAIDPSDLGDIIAGWYSYAYGIVASCSYRAEINGQDTRFSLGEALLISAACLAPFVLLAFLLPQVADVVFSWFGVVGAAGIVGLVISVSNGWSIGCAPMMPPILFTATLPQFVINTWLTECLWIGSGTIMQEDYNNVNCRDGELWTSGYFQFGHCARDFGWTEVLDVPVFILHVFFPDLLEYIKDPTNFLPPFSTLLQIDWVQENLARWDDLDLYQDDLVFSGHWTCFGFNLIAWVAIVFFFAVLINVAPVQGFANYLINLLFGTIRLFGWYAMALFAVINLLISAPAMIGKSAQIAALQMLDKRRR